MSIYSNLQIVAIEDDANMLEMLKDFIESKFPGALLTTYSTGEEAISGIFRQPDLIILDYHLDSADPMAMNGLQILNKIRARFKDVQIIFLSAQENTEIAANTMAYDYILKNRFAFQRLEVVIRNLMGQAELQKKSGTQRFFNVLLAGIVLALLAGIFWMRMND